MTYGTAKRLLTLFFGLIFVPPAQAQLSEVFPDHDPSPQSCAPLDRYPEDQVQICLDCNGRLYVNGVRVSVTDLDLVLIQLKKVPKPLRYKVLANTDVDMTTYLKLRSLMDRHRISPDYKITLASRRSLCR